MGQQDYILRMIEQLGRMLAALRARILGGESDARTVQERLREAGRTGGVDLEIARAMTTDTLVMMLSPAGELEPGRAWLMAELLYLDGLDAHLAGETERADASLQRALVLYRLIGPQTLKLVALPEAGDRIAEIERLLDSDPPPEAA